MHIRSWAVGGTASDDIGSVTTRTVNLAPAGAAIVPPRVRQRSVMVVFLLCLATGSVDAVCFLALGEAFASVMTGNLVLVGIATGTADARLALYCGASILAYGVGCVLAGRFVRALRDRDDRARFWPDPVRVCLIIESAMLATVAIIWAALPSAPAGWGRLAFLCACSLSMAIQSVAVRNLGVNVSTTYMTGAFTALLEALGGRRRFGVTERAAASGVSGLILGALVGASCLHLLQPAVFFVPLLAMVVLFGYARWAMDRPAAD